MAVPKWRHDGPAACSPETASDSPTGPFRRAQTAVAASPTDTSPTDIGRPRIGVPTPGPGTSQAGSSGAGTADIRTQGTGATEHPPCCAAGQTGHVHPGCLPSSVPPDQAAEHLGGPLGMGSAHGGLKHRSRVVDGVAPNGFTSDPEIRAETQKGGSP